MFYDNWSSAAVYLMAARIFFDAPGISRISKIMWNSDCWSDSSATWARFLHICCHLSADILTLSLSLPVQYNCTLYSTTVHCSVQVYTVYYKYTLFSTSVHYKCTLYTTSLSHFHFILIKKSHPFSFYLKQNVSPIFILSESKSVSHFLFI